MKTTAQEKREAQRVQHTKAMLSVSVATYILNSGVKVGDGDMDRLAHTIAVSLIQYGWVKP